MPKNTEQNLAPRNTVQDFLDTIKEDHVDIICPACGTPMGVKQQGSYEMVLTENARKEVNDILNLYRRYLQGVEGELETLNIRGFNRTDIGSYPYRDRKEEKLENALYKTAGSKVIKTFIQEKLDYYNWSDLLHGGKIPTLNQLEQANNGSSISSDSESKEEMLYADLMKVMIGGGFEPDLIISHIMSLVFDQYQVKTWMDQTKLEESHNNDNSPKLRQELAKCCPRIYGYVSRIETFIKNADAPVIKKLAVQLGQEALTKEQLIEDITRCLYILVLLFGYKSQQIDSLSGGILKHQVTFDLGKYVVVSPMRLKEILLSGVIAKRIGLRWEKDFLDVLKGQGADDKNNKEDFDSLMRGEISKFVHFACTGQSGYTTHNEGKEPQCGWYPKPKPTHPVVLIGSPGTGKSTVMLTGLTTFYSNAQALGTRVTFTSDEDVEMLKQYTKDFWEGILPKPNKEGTRYSVQLTVESTRDTQKREHFVFTDIPGEVAARSLTKEGTDPIVLGVLKHTKTIIFFFDLSIEPSILTPLINGSNKEAWETLRKSYEQTKEERKGRSEISQIQLLNKLIHNLREIRGEEGLKNINFVCVIPKSDLFVEEDDKSTKFFTGFYEGLLSKKKGEGLLIQSRYTPENESFAGLRSVAGIGSLKYKDEDPMNSQQEIIDTISEKATGSLKNIGDTLGTEAVDADKISLKNVVLGVIDTLETVFGQDSVYILPVSAQGVEYIQSSSQGGNEQPEERKQLKHPPNQKLSEYVFIIPVVLAMLENA
jgi:hypothetical protein